MTAPAHSPLPWSFREDGGDSFTLYDATGTKVAIAICDHVPMDEAEANALLVQRATAAHPLLVSSLQALVHALRSYELGNDSPDLAKELADAGDAVIAQMEVC